MQALTGVWEGRMMPLYLQRGATSTPRLQSASASGAPPSMDEATFEAFYRQTAPALYRYIRHLVGDPDLAEDILQTAFIKFLRRPPEWGKPAQVRAYLYRIATRLVYDHTRQKRRFFRFLLHQRRATPTSSGAATRDADLARLFAQLPLKERMILWLAYVEGYSHEEIARLLGFRKKSMGVLLYRARRRFASILRAAGYAPENRELSLERTPGGSNQTGAQT